MFREKIREFMTKWNDFETKKALHKENKETKEIQTIIVQTKENGIQTDNPEPQPINQVEKSIKQTESSNVEKTFEDPLISEASEYIKKYEGFEDLQRSIQSTTSLKKKITQV